MIGKDRFEMMKKEQNYPRSLLDPDPPRHKATIASRFSLSKPAYVDEGLFADTLQRFLFFCPNTINPDQPEKLLFIFRVSQRSDISATEIAVANNPAAPAKL